jgi:diphthamide biosynthesis methyltransferase
MLYVVGLGLSDEKDITVKGLEVGVNSLNAVSEADSSRPSRAALESTSNTTPQSSQYPLNAWKLSTASQLYLPIARQ